ncbi:hypothetical protein G5I_13685 [Acromyrmex echinatior]|uniref:Uncharacterized protein n=1 Tax=Acromyrmex echinatior TaxID=103372 RepID=F4X5P6_ACREC|nr:hypothetical protein G5I_13685 [Acromyrmex echinatior]
MRENGEDMEGQLDSISQVYRRRQTPVSMHLFSPGIWINVRRDAMTPVLLDNANVSPTFWVKELNPFDPGLDFVRLQVPVGDSWKEIRRLRRASEGQSQWRTPNDSVPICPELHTRMELRTGVISASFKNSHNREAISVKVVWLGGKTEVYQYRGDQTSIRIPERPDIFLVLSLISYNSVRDI